MMKTKEETKELLKRAATTVKMLSGINLNLYTTYWSKLDPKAELLKKHKEQPTPKELKEMDEVLDRLMKIEETDRKLLWARACNVRWEAIAHEKSISRVTLNKHYNASLVRFSHLIG